MNLLDVHKAFATEEQCLDHLEQMRWPLGVQCIKCGSERISRFTSKGKTGKERRLIQCLECRLQFTPTQGTVFHDTHLPLQKWFLAIALMCESKKGISANQLKRALGVQYRTAWYLCHRIRKTMTEDGGLLGLGGGIVEVDETYVGGRTHSRRRGRGAGKDVVIGMRQRQGRVKFIHADNCKSETLYKLIHDHISPRVDLIMTDEFSAYPGAMGTAFKDKHRTICHEKTYVMGNIHTNTVESCFSLLKRGIIGSFHKISLKHLHRYLGEFEYRYNNRKDADLFGKTLARLTGMPGMKYQELINDSV